MRIPHCSESRFVDAWRNQKCTARVGELNVDSQFLRYRFEIKGNHNQQWPKVQPGAGKRPLPIDKVGLITF